MASPAQTEDVVSLELVAAGDHDAFAGLVRPHLPALLGFAVRVAGEQAVGEDALQDVLAQAYRTLQRKTQTELEQLAIRPWLFRSLINRVRRLRGRQRETPTGLIVTAGGTSDADADAGRRSMLTLIDLELRRLPREWRAAILLRHHAGYEYEEIARILDRPSGTIKAWVHRGTRRVREGLREQGVEGETE